MSVSFVAFAAGCAATLDLDKDPIVDGGGSSADTGSSSDAFSDAGTDTALQPPKVKRIFVTRDVFTANLGGLSGADTICKTAADNAKLAGGPWIAWVKESDIKLGLNRLTRDDLGDSWYLVDGNTQVFANPAMLTAGSPKSAVNRDEYFNLIPGDAPKAWTGLGEACATTCGVWSTTNSPNGKGGGIGKVGALDRGWVSGGGGECAPCSGTAHLYCLENN